MPLEAKNIYFRYDRKQPWILEDCSVRVDRGECLAISAPSGYGKTTLAMLLSGYIKPVKGEILIDGKVLPEKGGLSGAAHPPAPGKGDKSALETQACS